jgi:hypothetical protein
MNVKAINNIYLGVTEVKLLIEGLQRLEKEQPDSSLPTDLINKLIEKGNNQRCKK